MNEVSHSVAPAHAQPEFWPLCWINSVFRSFYLEDISRVENEEEDKMFPYRFHLD